MQPNIQIGQINGFSEDADGAISMKSYQQDTIIAGISQHHIDSPQRVLDMLLEVQNGLTQDWGTYEIDFHVTASVNSIHSNGDGHISIVNGTAGDSVTHVLLVNRNTDTVEIVSEGAKNGLWLGAFIENETLQSVEEATNIWDVTLHEGQELHVISMSDGIPFQRNPMTIVDTPDCLLLESVKDYLLETPYNEVDLTRYLINYAEAFKTKDNASVATQSFTKDSPAGNSIIGVFDATDGTDDDMASFRTKLDTILNSERYSGPIEKIQPCNTSGSAGRYPSPAFSLNFF
ncbi:MAG: hypothetical protein AB7E85_04685 [Pseudobdellovibrionaceae bacterium]